MPVGPLADTGPVPSRHFELVLCHLSGITLKPFNYSDTVRPVTHGRLGLRKLSNSNGLW